jgi:hypothetical protein
MQKQRTGGHLRMEAKAMGIMVKVLVLLGGFSRDGACIISELKAFLQNRYYPLINTILRWWVMSYPWTSTKVSGIPTSQHLSRHRCRPSAMIDTSASLQEYVMLHVLFFTKLWVVEGNTKLTGTPLAHFQ